MGKELLVGKSMKSYYAAPKAKSGRGMGVVVVHDIFGFALPNCRYICDYLAARGFDAVMPDLYSEKQGVDLAGWPTTEAEVTKPLEGEDFSSFWSAITTSNYWAGFQEDINECINFLQKKGCVHFGIIGFCWGGLAAEMAAKSGRFTLAVSAHGCGHTAETFREVKGNIFYITVDDDPFFGKAAQDAIISAGGKLKVFIGMKHGFMVRGDYANDAAVKAAADEAMALAETAFSNSCLRKPTYSKVGALHPQSQGVTLLVKVLGEPIEADEQRKGAGHTMFYDVTCGDETGQITMSLKDTQTEGIVKHKVICVRNGSIKMVRGFMRLVVDKWGKLDRDVEGTVECIGDTDLSSLEFEVYPA